MLIPREVIYLDDRCDLAKVINYYTSALYEQFHDEIKGRNYRAPEIITTRVRNNLEKIFGEENIKDISHKFLNAHQYAHPFRLGIIGSWDIPAKVHFERQADVSDAMNRLLSAMPDHIQEIARIIYGDSYQLTTTAYENNFGIKPVGDDSYLQNVRKDIEADANQAIKEILEKNTILSYTTGMFFEMFKGRSGQSVKVIDELINSRFGTKAQGEIDPKIMMLLAFSDFEGLKADLQESYKVTKYREACEDFYKQRLEESNSRTISNANKIGLGLTFGAGVIGSAVGGAIPALIVGLPSMIGAKFIADRRLAKKLSSKNINEEKEKRKNGDYTEKPKRTLDSLNEPVKNEAGIRLTADGELAEDDSIVWQEFVEQEKQQQNRRGGGFLGRFRG